jgi:Serine/threonine protein phosphatase
MHFTTAIRSGTGGRSKNQDDADHFTQNGLAGWVLADGLGGHRGGGLASSLATDTMLHTCTDRGALARETISAAAQAAQETLHERQRKHPEYSRMRTTFVLLLVNPDGGGPSGGTPGTAGSTTSETAPSRTGRRTTAWCRPSSTRASWTPRISATTTPPTASSGPSAIRTPPTRTWWRNRWPSSPAMRSFSAPTGSGEAVHEDEMLDARAEAATPEDWIDTMAAPIEAAAGEDQDNYTAVAVFVQNA